MDSPADNASQDANRNYLRASVFALSCACPYDQGNPADCQLCKVRAMLPTERIKWANSLSNTEMLSILTKHRRCLAAKES